MRERRYTAALIAHLAEISRRKGHLELGFKSLFDYCRIHLGLGKGSVWSRTQLANVSRRFPQVLQHLVEGKMSLSSLGVLAPHLSEENVERLLAEAAGKTKEEEALDLALEKKDPKQKLERRKKRESARSKTRLDEASPPKTCLDEAAGAKKREAPSREGMRDRGTFRVQCASVFWSVRTTSVSSGDRAVCGPDSA